MNEEDKSLWDYHEIQNRQSFMLAKPRLDYIANRLSRQIKLGKVLDIGIGDGYLLMLLSKKFQIFGIDISDLNIQKTHALFQARLIPADLRQASIDEIPHPDKMFGAVTASEVLEHLDDKTLDKALGEIRRVLHEGGTFIGTVPAIENLNESICFCPRCKNTFHRWGHKQSFTEESLKTLFSRNGFWIKRFKLLTFYGVQMDTTSIFRKMKFIIGKTLFFLLKRIFAPQWWFYFEVVKVK